jgi:FkbM family methyltransferase
MNVVEKAIRHGHVPFYAFKLLWETVRAWGFRKWCRFWLSSDPKPLLTMDGLTFEVRGRSIKSKMTDTFAIMEQVYHKLYNRRFYNDEFRIGENDTVIDIGGYIGSFAVPAARFARKGTVYSFEPSPDNFAQLERNLALNGVTNVRAFNMAVASTDRKITLFLDNMNPASNNIYMRGGNQVEKDAVSLATFFDRQGIGRCEFFKIDCEGAEYEILMNLDPSILGRIGKIACELHEPIYYGVTNPNHTPRALIRFLEGNGFTVYRTPVNPYLWMLYAVNKRFAP